VGVDDPDDPRHGTRNFYERHKCRCDRCRAVNAARHRAWVVENRERHRELSRRSYIRHRSKWLVRKVESRDHEKERARSVLNAAVERGDVVRGRCEREGPDCSGDVQAHHDDYSKPLDVRWLCRSHHRYEHLAAA
jgi:hypothetical protein